MNEAIPMTADSVRELLEKAGARVMVRSGRSDSYGAPRDFSFEVKAVFPNAMGLQIVARQFNYRDPWEAEGRVNDMVDVSLLRDGSYSPLPRGNPFFQGVDIEEGVEEARLREIIACVARINPKICRKIAARAHAAQHEMFPMRGKMVLFKIIGVIFFLFFLCFVAIVIEESFLGGRRRRKLEKKVREELEAGSGS